MRLNFTFKSVSEFYKLGALAILFFIFHLPSYGQQNIAPLAIVTADGSTLNNKNSGGCKVGACNTLNDLSIDTCGAQEMFLTTANPPNTIEGWDYIEWSFSFEQYFDTLVIHHGESANRSLTGATIQYWENGNWKNHSSFSNLPQQCVNRVGIPPLMTSRFRITLFEMEGALGQTSNPNFREIEILEASRGLNDVGIADADSLKYLPAGNNDVKVTLQNYGLNQIDSLNIFWEVNGVLQTTKKYIGLIDTANGYHPKKISVNLGTYNFQSPTQLKIYTNLPNGSIDTINSNDTIEFMVYPALSGTYTVDPSIAASPSNFIDISSMASALNQYGVSGSTTINIATGIYNESLFLDDIPGASAVNHIIIDGNDSAQTIVQQNGSIDNATLTFNGSQHVHVKNMSFKMTGSSGKVVVFAANANNNTLSNCQTWIDPSFTAQTTKNIFFTAHPSLEILGNGGNYNILKDNYIIGGYSGIEAKSNSLEVGIFNQFLNNRIDSVYDMGVAIDYQDSLSFIGNTIDMLSRKNSDAKGSEIKNSNYTIFKQNYIWAANYALVLNNQNVVSPWGGRNYKLVNNMLYSSNSYGLRIKQVDFIDVWHNSINVTAFNDPAVIIEGTASKALKGFDVRNNIFSAKNTEAMVVNQPDTFFTNLDYNIYNTYKGKDLFNINGTPYGNLVSYIQSQPAYNANSIHFDPEFVGSKDLHILGITAYQAGDSLGVSEDIDGESRPAFGASSVSIGADEFTPPICIPPSNISITSIGINRVDIQWVGHSGSGTSFRYVVVSCGDQPLSGITHTTVQDSLTISGLSPNTCYDLYVKDICGSRDSSVWRKSPLSFNTLAGVPFKEDFESFPAGINGNPWKNGWESTTTVNPRWESQEATGNNLNATGTGPLYDHTNFGIPGGKYVFMNVGTVFGATPRTAVDFYSTSIRVDSSMDKLKLDYWYFMHGSGIDGMDVIVDTNNVEQVIASYSGQQQASQSDNWLLGSSYLNGYEGKEIVLKFRGYYTVTGWIIAILTSADIAIDDISLMNVSTNDAAVVEMVEPSTFCSGNINPVVAIQNNGIDTLDTITVIWEANNSKDSITYHGSIPLGDTVHLQLGTVSFTGNNDSLMVYTRRPNGKIDDNKTDDTLKVFNPIAGLSGNYTLDPSQPVSATNFTSFDSLETLLNTVGICGSTTINIAPGTYNTSLHLKEIKGASVSNSLLIDGGDSSQTIMVHDGSERFATLTFEGTRYVHIKNMAFKMTKLSNSAVLFTDSARHDTLSHCVTWVPPTASKEDSWNIAFSGSSNINTTFSTAEYILLQNNHIIGGDFGIRGTPSTNTFNKHNKIVGNIVDSTYRIGIYLYRQDSLQVISNKIDMLWNSGAMSSSVIIYESSGVKFSSNYLWARKYGAEFNRSEVAPSTNPLALYPYFEISNNMLYSKNGNALRLNSIKYAKIYHNSAYAEGSEATILIEDSYFKSLLNYDLRNNIFQSKTETALEVGVSDSVFSKFNNNIYYSDGDILLDINEFLYTNLLSYQTAQPAFNDASLEVDPIFISTTDLHMYQGIAAKQAGDNSVGITVDIDGDERPLTGDSIVDIGADEFIPPPCPFLTPTFDNVTTNSVVINYDFTKSGSDVEYVLVPCGTPRKSGTVMLSNIDSILHVGLNSGNCYEVYLREICSVSDTSFWSGPFAFHTTYNIPYFENFESFDSIAYNPWPNGWSSTTVLLPRWETNSGSTPTAQTGPDVDHTLGTSSGTYVFLETSEGNNGDSADFISPAIQFSANHSYIELTYWFHFYGSTVGAMDVIVDSNGTETIVSTISGSQQNAESDPWLKDSVLLKGYEGKIINIIFRGRRGTSYTGNIAVDDIVLRDATPYYPIATLNTSNSNGEADSLNVEAWTSGTVVGVDLNAGNGLGFALIDQVGGNQNGIYVYSSNDVSGYTVNEGDSIKVRGTVDQFNGLTQLRVDSIEVISTGNAIPSARLVSNLDESTESQWLQMEDFVLLDSSQTGSYNMQAHNTTDTITIRINAQTDVSDSLADIRNSLSVGDTICVMKGIGGQFDQSSPYTEGYQITPMYFSDMNICKKPVGLKTAVQAASGLRFYPNPTKGSFTIATSGLENDNALITIRDISGKVIIREKIINSSSAFKKHYTLEGQAKGLYLISIIDGEQRINKKLILQ